MNTIQELILNTVFSCYVVRFSKLGLVFSLGPLVLIILVKCVFIYAGAKCDFGILTSVIKGIFDL